MSRPHAGLFIGRFDQSVADAAMLGAIPPIAKISGVPVCMTSSTTTPRLTAMPPPSPA